MKTITRKESVLMQQRIDTLKKINLSMCINIESSKLFYPKKIILPKWIQSILATYI